MFFFLSKNGIPCRSKNNIWHCFFHKKMVPECKPEWNREAITVFSRLPSLRRLQATPLLQTSLGGREYWRFSRWGPTCLFTLWCKISHTNEPYEAHSQWTWYKIWVQIMQWTVQITFGTKVIFDKNIWGLRLYYIVKKKRVF